MSLKKPILIKILIILIKVASILIILTLIIIIAATMTRKIVIQLTIVLTSEIERWY